MDPNQNFCRYCKNIIDVNAYFCPNCGKKLRDKPLSTSLLAQIGVYALSIFAPPFGLIPAFKYLKQDNGKTIGMLAILLTLISLGFTVWFTINFINSINKTLNSQLQYPGVGF